ncbi:MAG: gliding motility-associated C-terminal domain-containing protein [Microscillaceae bacterium]|jgi:gliding motility-associated-like protein|nr:gliding motility-associated C-terminal domain-containing protein [Microscillaceae bacterium]
MNLHYYPPPHYLTHCFLRFRQQWGFWVGLLFLSILNVSAQEGTKQLMPNTNDILYIELNAAGSDFASYTSPERERLYIYLKAGEKLHLGMKMSDPIDGSAGVPDNTTFRIKDPSGAIAFPQTTFPASTRPTGFIADYTQATAGPNGAILNGVAISTGYTPFIFTATTTGDHYIEFETWNLTNPFRTPNNRRTYIEFFDATVTDAANNIITNPSNPNRSAGRVWSRQWALVNKSFTANPIKASFYIYTDDGFVNRVQYDMSTFSYLFVSNTFGVRKTADSYINRQSIVGNAFNAQDISQHKVFLNDPDLSVYPNSSKEPTAKIWFNNRQIYDYQQTRSPQSLPLNPGIIPLNANQNGCPHPTYAIFRIESNIAGQLQVNLDLDNNGFNLAGGIDRVLFQDVKSDTIAFLTWDLKDALGQPIPAGTNFSAKAIFLLAGITHFPIYDVETMNSVQTEAVRPYNRFNPTLYWDDLDLQTSGSTLTIHPTSAATQLIPNATTARRWVYNGNNNSFNNGNLNTVNSWFSGLELVTDFQYTINTSGLCINDNCDQDNIPNVNDTDDDNDGLPDMAEYIVNIDPYGDEDNDGVFNYRDSNLVGFIDANNDGINDVFDQDKDGIINSCDLDSDNDGISDVIEAGGVDANSNGLIYDNTFTDIDLDGLEDTIDPLVVGGTAGTPLLNLDSDLDGVKNFLDKDTDSDGIPDNREGQTTPGYKTPLSSGTIDSDGDGLNDAYDPFFNANNTLAPFSAFGTSIANGTYLIPVNTDNLAGDAPDILDADSDNDLARDWVEGFDDNENGASLEDLLIRAAVYETVKNNPGHYPNTDANTNGLPDWLDDQDTDGVPNYQDAQSSFFRDTDKDGMIDLYDEDAQGKGYGNTTIPFAEPDNNNNGAPNYRDVQTVVCLQAPVTTFSGNTTLCEGENLILTANQATAISYTWRKGNTIVGNAKTLTINGIALSNAGNDYTLEVDNGSCKQISNLFSVSVTVAPDITFTGATTACEGTNLVLTANQNPAVSYTWRKGNTIVGNAKILTINNLANTDAGNDYTLEVNTGSCVRTSNAFSIAVSSQPKIDLAVSALSASICLNASGIVQIANSEADVIYQLKLNNTNIGAAINGNGSTLPINTGNLSSAGDYVYSVEALRSGCTLVVLTQTATITVLAQPKTDLNLSAETTTLCVGNTGTNILIQNSEADVTYQLRNGTTNLGTALNGNGGILALPTGAINANTTFNVLAQRGNCTAIQLTQTAQVTVNPNPDLLLSVSVLESILCENNSGTSVVINNTQTDVSYQLRIGISNIGNSVSGNGGNIEIPTGAISTTTVFNVLATRNGCIPQQLSNTVEVFVNPLPKINLVVSPSQSIICGFENTGTTIKIDNSELFVNYQLQSGGNDIGMTVAGTGGTIELPTGKVLNEGLNTYTILAIRQACEGVELTQKAEITLVPELNLGLDVSVDNSVLCGANTGTNLNVIDSQLGVSYQLRVGLINLGNPMIGTGNTISLPTGAITANGITTFNVLASRAGCTAAPLTETVEVSLNKLPETNLTLQVQNPSLCVGNTGTDIIIKNSEAGVFYQLQDSNNNNLGTAQAGNGGDLLLSTGVITNLGANTFKVMGVVTNCSPVKIANDLIINVFNNIIPTVSISGGQSGICAGQPTVLGVNATDAGLNPTYRWFLNNVQVATTATFSSNLLKNGDKVKVEMTSSIPCTAPITSAELTIQVNPLPNVQIKAKTTEGVLGCELELTVEGAQTYTWTPLASIINLSPSGNRVVVKPTQTTEYIVTGTDANGCTNKDTLKITILPKEELFVPTLFTPNGDKNNDVFIVHAECIADINVKVFDRSGNLVYEARTVEQATQIGWDGTLGGREQPTGKYIWRIEGKCANGLPLLYQGKNSGTINLFR